MTKHNQALFPSNFLAN